jgi:arginine-tRNA-protein transferase
VNVKRPPDPAHKFEVTLEPDDFTQEKFELFKNYQQHVHHDPPGQVSPKGFRRFLCSSPLHRTTRTVDGKTQQLGSYHQCYRVDGRLIAMGVLDLLPHCVSGVYLIYHSDFEKWSFGKLSAMREIAFAIEGGYQYYYMGYYIHSCTKMRYKGEYKPSYLLDPETYEWNPLDGELRQLLDTKSYVSLSRERRQAANLEVQGGHAQSSPKPAVEAEEIPKEYPLPTAAEAAAAIRRGMSLFELKVPGLMTADEVQQDGLLDSQAIKLKSVPFPVEAQVSSCS